MLKFKSCLYMTVKSILRLVQVVLLRIVNTVFTWQYGLSVFKLSYTAETFMNPLFMFTKSIRHKFRDVMAPGCS